MYQPGRGERRQPAHHAEAGIVADGDDCAAKGGRRRFDEKRWRDGHGRPDDDHEAELAQHDQARVRMVHQPEERDCPQHAGRGSHSQQRLAADPVAQPAGGQHDRHDRDHARGIDVERPLRRNAVDELQPTHDVEEHQVVTHGAEGLEGRDSRQQRLVAAKGFPDRFMPTVRWQVRLLDVPTQDAAHHADQQAEQEGDAPAPIVEFVDGQEARHHRAGARSQEHAAGGCRRGAGAGQAAPMRQRGFDGESEGRRTFAPGRQALHDAQQRQDDRRGDAQRLVTGQQADQERRHGHGDDGEAERSALAVAIADRTDDQAAQRAHDVAGGEYAERRQDLRDLVPLGKEVLADRHGEIAVDREIVPFEKVSNDARGDEPDPVALLHGRKLSVSSLRFPQRGRWMSSHGENAAVSCQFRVTPRPGWGPFRGQNGGCSITEPWRRT